MKSGAIASMLRAVSMSVSPFTRLEAEALKLRESAERRFSASSNDVRVRVDGSMKRFTTVLPRSVGTFLISRREISSNDSAVSRMRTISSGASGSIPSRCRLFSLTSALLLREDVHGVRAVLLPERDADLLVARSAHVLPDVVGTDR